MVAVAIPGYQYEKEQTASILYEFHDMGFLLIRLLFPIKPSINFLVTSNNDLWTELTATTVISHGVNILCSYILSLYDAINLPSTETLCYRICILRQFISNVESGSTNISV